MPATPPTLVLRIPKQQPLTALEMDNNFTLTKQYVLDAETQILDGTSTFTNDVISGDIIDGGTVSNFASTGIDDNAAATALTLDSSGHASLTGNVTLAGNIVLSTASATVDGRDLTVDGAKLDASASAATASTLVIRDASGDFAAGTVTANVTGNVTGNVAGDVTGNVTATSVLADGVSATTQSAGDNSTKASTTAYADAAAITYGSPTGAVSAYAGSTAPTNWLLCDGAAISRTTYAALFAVIGTTYGTTSSTDFKVPDMRGRVVAGQDDMGGTSADRLTNPGTTTGGIDGDVLGGTGGSETHQLTIAELALHEHPGIHQHQNINAGTSNGGSNQHDQPSANGVGGDVPHNNVQPTLILNYIIKSV